MSTPSRYDDVKPRQESLKIDPPIPGQQWVVLSFLSPEEAIRKRELFTMNHWLHFEVNRTLRDQALHAAKKVNADISQRLNETINRLGSSANETDRLVFHHLKELRGSLQLNEEALATECLHDFHLDLSEIEDRYTVYRAEHYQEIENRFVAANGPETSVRGVKIRGVFENQEEAKERAKYLRDSVEPGIHAHVGQVGFWLAWDPDPDNVKESNYLNEELNKLMTKYQENVQQKNRFFEERKQEMVESARAQHRDHLKAQLKERMLARRRAQ